MKKVLKIKPHKKIIETDAIFANVNKQHELAKNNSNILHISIDVKAKVKIGNLSRKGYSRAINAPITDDHDHHWTDILTPFGVHEITTENTFLTFGNSRETPDFIVDCLEKWWSDRQFEHCNYDTLMIDLDNGSSVGGNTKRFLQRMVQFAALIKMKIQMVYYPPYHSKYNTIERFWAAVEKYWNPLVLDTISNTIEIAKNVVWKATNPIVGFINKTYKKGVKVTKEDAQETEKFIQRNPNLKKWDFSISFTPNW